MVAELDCHVFVKGVTPRNFDSDLEHNLAEERHPGSAVGLLEVTASRQRRAAVEHTNVIQPKKATLERPLAKAILAVHPPAEVQRQFGEGTLEELNVALSFERLFGPI